ncbi:unnamed protein product [Rotaria sp. Silwood1]|nr:unnamed protein product [Rotaria sp. Silwood1]
MDSLLEELIENNEDELKNEFDYLNRNTKQVKDVNVEINDYLQKQTDSNFQLKNLVKLSPVLYEFLTGKKFDINNDPPSSTSTGAQRTTSKN